MKSLEAAYYIAKVLMSEEARLSILSGSAARGKENPNDLDISAVFRPNNRLLDRQYRSNLIERLSSEVGYKLHLFDFSERYVDKLIEVYNQNPIALCRDLNFDMQDHVVDQWKGWPLAWLFGKDAHKILDPYACFQDEFIVLEGADYLAELKSRIKIPNGSAD